MLEKIVNLGNGVDGLFIKNDRFNSTLLSFHFFLPLNAESIERNALLPFLLSSCTKEYKDFTALNIRLLELYGGILSSNVNKNGDNLHISINLNLVNNDLTFENEDIISKGADLLFSMLFAPFLNGDSFSQKDVEREKRQTIDRIEGEINNKRSFARSRLTAEMFGNDPYGLFVYGKAEKVLKITGEELYSAWQELLNSAYVRLHVVGKTLPDGIFEKLGKEFSNIKRENVLSLKKAALLPKTQKVNTVTEYFAVSQGKLTLGYTCSENGEREEALPHLLFSDIFGGGTYSKLFNNVREKQSLCYYCSAATVFKKGYMLVDSGIDPQNAQKVIDAVNHELDEIKKGNINEFEIESSKKAIYENLMSCYDSASSLDLWYSRSLDNDKLLSPLEVAEKIKGITKEEIVRAANTYDLHTIYKLLPEGSGE